MAIEYKKLIEEAGYQADPKFVEELTSAHEKLINHRLIDRVFKSLYRKETKEPRKGSKRRAQSGEHRQQAATRRLPKGEASSLSNLRCQFKS
jgi:hypothetical protein